MPNDKSRNEKTNLIQNTKCTDQGDKKSPLEKSERKPIRDLGISQVHKYYHENGDIPDELKIPVDKTFVRAFSCISNAAIPSCFQPLLTSYVKWAQSHLKDPRDVTFITHILFSYFILIPSALILFFRDFSWVHAIGHTIVLILSISPFILMQHCICHKCSGNERGWWVDASVHYTIPIFYGQTWFTFYFHHVKHHHIEDNGYHDLSATFWYDRDNAFHFLKYFSRFFFLCGIDLTGYFIKKEQYIYAAKVLAGEYLGWLLYFTLFFFNSDPRNVIFAFIVPFIFSRFGMMSGNWAQHAFLDSEDSKNDYRTALTCIEIPYNALCFNDGYHTSHHLNSRRHWQDLPEHFISSLETFKKEKTIIFRNIDYFAIWGALMIRSYNFLARHLVTLENATLEEKVAFLKSRTKAFTRKQIKLNYGDKMQ